MKKLLSVVFLTIMIGCSEGTKDTFVGEPGNAADNKYAS